jgi:hypothetical protein
MQDNLQVKNGDAKRQGREIIGRNINDKKINEIIN